MTTNVNEIRIKQQLTKSLQILGFIIIAILLIYGYDCVNTKVLDLTEQVEVLNDQVYKTKSTVGTMKTDIEQLRNEIYEFTDTRDYQTTDLHSRIDTLVNQVTELETTVEE